MAKPVNKITGDAPDSTNPDKKQVPSPPEGKFKYTPPKPNPKDAGVFTEEMLQRSGGKMKTIPENPEVAKKRGGSIRRYARGGEIMDTEVVDEKEASDKEAGLKASKGEDVGFFKRLSMGNIDEPGSEAYQQFGAGRGRMPSRQAVTRDVSEGFSSQRKQASAPMDDNESPRQSSKALESIYDNETPRQSSKSNAAVKVDKELKKTTPTNAPAKQVAATKASEGKGNTLATSRDLRVSSEDRSGPTVAKAEARQREQDEAEARYKDITRPGRDAIENVYPEAFLLPGKGLGSLFGRKAAAEAGATGSSSRALTTNESPLTFLGKGERQNLTPKERIGTSPKSLEYKSENVGSLEGKANAGRLEGKTSQELEFLGRGERRNITPKERLGAEATKRLGMNARQIEGRKPPEAPSYPKGSQAKAMEDFLKGKSSKGNKTSFRGDESGVEFKRGGNIKKYASGGSVSASSRGDGCAQRGKTRGMMR